MGWGQLQSMLDEQRAAAREEQRRGHQSCPICGSKLDYDERRGLLNCPLGHFEAAGRAGR